LVKRLNEIGFSDKERSWCEGDNIEVSFSKKGSGFFGMWDKAECKSNLLSLRGLCNEFSLRYETFVFTNAELM
jgi:hypothetical protein